MEKQKNKFYYLLSIKLYFCIYFDFIKKFYKNFKKTPILICLFVFGLPFKSFSITTQPVGVNIDEEHEAILAFLEDLASAPAITQASGKSWWGVSSPLRSSEPFFASARGVQKQHVLDLKDADRSPSSVNATLSAMILLAKVAAESLGGSSQACMAQTLRTYGAELADFRNLPLSGLGELMQQEATAIDLGDGNGAQALVAAMQSLPRADGTTDAPRPSDRAWQMALEQMDQQIVESAQDSLGQAAQQSLDSWLQTQGGSDSSFSIPLPSLGSGAPPAGGSSSGDQALP